MTTHVLSGIRVNRSADGQPVAAGTTTMKIVSTDFYRIGFEAEGKSGDFVSVDITDVAGTTFDVILNGSKATASGVVLTEFAWGNGKTTQVMILYKNTAAGSIEYMFEIGGDRLPPVGSLADFLDFRDRIDDLSPALPSRFTSGKPLDLADFPSFVALTQNDVLIANPAYDDWGGITIKTGIGRDLVDGIGENERFNLGSGDDTGIGGGGRDTILGGSGDDRLLGESGLDRLYGEGGNDTLFGGTATDMLFGGAGVDSLSGGLDADILYGGGSGDALRGDAGADKLYGGMGADRLDGGTGADSLIGGLGSDAFVFAAGNGADRVSDFQDDIDRLVLNRDLGVASAAEALDKAQAYGTHVLFDFGGGDTLLVLNTTKAALADDIVLIG